MREAKQILGGLKIVEKASAFEPPYFYTYMATSYIEYFTNSKKLLKNANNQYNHLIVINIIRNW